MLDVMHVVEDHSKQSATFPTELCSVWRRSIVIKCLSIWLMIMTRLTEIEIPLNTKNLQLEINVAMCLLKSFSVSKSVSEITAITVLWWRGGLLSHLKVIHA